MSEPYEMRFSELVGSRLASEEEARALWNPLAQELDRGGPDAARAYLNAECQRLEGRIQNLLEQIREE